MDKETQKKLKLTIIKLIAIIVSIFVVSYAWYVYEVQSDIAGVSVGTAKTNNILVSSNGESDWSANLDINVGENFIFNEEVTSDGINFYKAATKNENGNPTSFTQAVINKDYLDFDLWFKNDSTISMFLENESIVYPESGTKASDLIYDSTLSNSNLENIIRLSSYGNFSRDLIAGAVRVAIIGYNYDEETSQYILEDTPKLVWAPNKNYYIYMEDGVYKADINSNVSQDYSFTKVNNTSNFNTSRVINLKDNINASFSEKKAYGDPMLIRIETEEGVEKKAGIKVRVWVEGNDREAVQAVKGGIFKFNLSFVGIQKELNNLVPNVSANTTNNTIEDIEVGMQYSKDYANTWIDYNNSTISISTGDTIYVRYAETDNKFASNYVILEY